MPAIRNLTQPRIGRQFQLEISNLLPNKFGFLVIGESDKTWRSQTLPLNLGFMGMGNCQMLVSWDIAFPIWSGIGGAAWKVKVPNNPGLLGATFYNQAWVMDPKANAFGAAVSNGGKGILGL